MDMNVSFRAVLESLRAQIAHHREQEALHAEREAFHRERRAAHAAELEQLTRNVEALEATAATALGLAARQLQVPSADDSVQGRRLSINAAVVKVVEGKGPHEPFGPRGIAAEVNQRFGKRLRRAVDERQVSVSLRWLSKGRGIFCFEEGRPHHEARYVRGLPMPTGS